MKFQRYDRYDDISYIYTAAAGLEPGRYHVRSLVLGDFAGLSTVLGYIVEHEGKLRRLWLS